MRKIKGFALNVANRNNGAYAMTDIKNLFFLAGSKDTLLPFSQVFSRVEEPGCPRQTHDLEIDGSNPSLAIQVRT